jgi:hypothetical protein
MKIRKVIISAVLLSSIPFSANAQAELTGDTRSACEAILCLASPTRPTECAAAIARYFSISLKRFSQTVRARRSFLQLCPTVDSQTIEQIVNNYLPEPDPPEPTPAPAPSNPTTRAEIEARIAQLVPVLEAQTTASTNAENLLNRCMQRNGGLQNVLCVAEQADYSQKRQAALNTNAELTRLQELLDTLNCTRGGKYICDVR